jgi:hypothetical protein
MLRFLLLIGLMVPVLAFAQQQSSQETLLEAYSLCTKRYIEHDVERKKTAKWQSGFENCDKIVSSWEATQHKLDDPAQHKSKIDAIAVGVAKAP